MAKRDRKLKRRWLVYLLVGIAFGVFDFFFQIWIFQLSPMASLAPILAIWLLPLVPVILYETKISRSMWLAAVSGALTWSVSVISYYLFMGVKLILIGQASRAELHISNRHELYYWSNIKSFFEHDVLGGISEWMGIALGGGSLIGLIIAFVMTWAKKPRPKNSL